MYIYNSLFMFRFLFSDNSVIPQENKKTFYVAFDFYKVNWWEKSPQCILHIRYNDRMNMIAFRFMLFPFR